MIGWIKCLFGHHCWTSRFVGHRMGACLTLRPKYETFCYRCDKVLP